MSGERKRPKVDESEEADKEEGDFSPSPDAESELSRLGEIMNSFLSASHGLLFQCLFWIINFYFADASMQFCQVPT
jgi:hypothetical protein